VRFRSAWAVLFWPHSGTATSARSFRAGRCAVADRSFTTKVRGCARCGGDHRAVLFKPFRRACDPFTHWAACPRTGEPILLLITEAAQVRGGPTKITRGESTRIVVGGFKADVLAEGASEVDVPAGYQTALDGFHRASLERLAERAQARKAVRRG
jgi:hypothetical protein